MSDLEDLLLAQIHAAELPEPVRELRFHPPRKWRLDFSWPDKKVAVEVEGGLYARRKDGSIGGGHQSPSGFANNIEKYNALALDGWLLLRFTRAMIEDGTAIETLETVLTGGLAY